MQPRDSPKKAYIAIFFIAIIGMALTSEVIIDIFYPDGEISFEEIDYYAPMTSINRITQKGSEIQYFPDHTIIAVYSGTKPSCGYDINVTKVESIGGQLYVHVLESGPRSCLVCYMLTYPRYIFRINVTYRNYIFIWSSEEFDCY